MGDVPTIPSRAHVLIVDDDAVGARELARTVEEIGHRATLANSWTDAIRNFGAEDVDLVLMDAVMPTVDGFKLTKILRARASSYVPIVFVTGLADASAREQGVAVGADDFLTKPVDALELKVRMTAMLRIRHLTQDLEAKSRALSRLANLDGLTGIENRRSFDDRLPAELDRARRYEHPLSLLMLDIDHFKRVNDRYGHAVGDTVLEFFGRMLNESTRACDLVYRYGGEEFVLIAPETDSAAALVVAERVRHAFELRSPEATRAGPQTVSIGASGTDLWEREVDASDLLYGADMALYQAKSSGRNRVACYDPSGETLEL